MKLLNIQKEIPDILLDIRYCTTYNFIGEIIDGYIDPVALGTKELVKQLKVINSKARQMGYRLKIWDLILITLAIFLVLYIKMD